MIDLIFKRLKGKTILIAGFGREGKSSYQFLKKYLPHSVFGIADKNETALKDIDSQKYKLYYGDNYLDAMRDYDIILKTPGISLKGIDITGLNISSQTDLFLEAFHDQVIGVTGTKGKSTTSSLIYHLLNNSGRESILCGNIGIPVFDIIGDITKKTIIVYELSAHQLEFIHRSPHIGLLLNVFEEHLDHFGTMSRYRDAKMNIMRYMEDGDCAVINNEFSYEASELAVRSLVFSYYDFPVEWDKMPLKGEHNILNMRAALCACWCYGISIDELLPHLQTFQPLEHRQELVGTFNGITYFNDSISTIPQATIAALETIKDVDFLLLGGYDRGIDYEPLVDYLINHCIKNLLYTGEAGRRIHNLLKANDYQGNMIEYCNMYEAVEYVKLNGKSGEKCLLSPAAASYDQYKNFEERGRAFKDKCKDK